jgi:hypothetical protein
MKAPFEKIDEIVVRVEIRNALNILQQLADKPGLLKKVIFNGSDGRAVQTDKDEFTVTVSKTVTDTAKASRTLQVFFKGVTTAPKTSQMLHYLVIDFKSAEGVRSVYHLFEVYDNITVVCKRFGRDLTTVEFLAYQPAAEPKKVDCKRAAARPSNASTPASAPEVAEARKKKLTVANSTQPLAVDSVEERLRHELRVAVETIKVQVATVDAKVDAKFRTMKKEVATVDAKVDDNFRTMKKEVATFDAKVDDNI